MAGAGAGGYIAEFVTFLWKPLMRDILDRGIRVVTNAGGLDPRALKAAIEQVGGCFYVLNVNHVCDS